MILPVASENRAMPAPFDRREFLKQAAASAVAVGIVPAGENFLLAADEKKDEDKKDPNVDAQAGLPIVDTHEHLWDLTKFKLPWTKGNETLGHSFVTRDYLEATQGLNLVKSVYMEVDVDPAQQMQEADYVIDLCQRKDNPMVAAVISGRPASSDFRAYIMKYKDSP